MSVIIFFLLLFFFILFLWIPPLIELLLGIMGFLSWKKLKLGVQKIEKKHTSRFGFCKGAFFAFVLLFGFVTFSDFDGDGLPLHIERRNKLDPLSNDTDRDIMKDGIEHKESNVDRSLFHPNNPDVNSDKVSDFCNAIIRHKVKNDRHFADVVRSGLSRTTTIGVCDMVLDAKSNFQFCWNSKSKNPVLLNMRCNDLVFMYIPDLRKVGYYLSYR